MQKKQLCITPVARRVEGSNKSPRRPIILLKMKFRLKSESHDLINCKMVLVRYFQINITVFLLEWPDFSSKPCQGL